MKRREFLAGATSLSVLAFVPLPKVDASPFVIVDGNIHYVGAPEAKYTLTEFYKYVSMQWSDVAKMSTDYIIELQDGFNIDDKTAEHLTEGSLIQDGGETIYSHHAGWG